MATEAVPLAWLPAGEPIVFSDPPAVQAALVERVAWRLEPSLFPRVLVSGGREEPDPALYLGLRVRSAKKTRRTGPPVIIALADRDQQGVVGVLDRDADHLLANDVFDLGKPPPTPHILPAFDGDGDGDLELLVWGGEGDRSFRIIYSLDLGSKISLNRTELARQGNLHCTIAPPNGSPG